MPGQSNDPNSESFRELREAVRLSPQNVPLRRHLADLLLSGGRHVEAEQAYREALALAPENTNLQLGLARAFFAQGKNSHALALIETLVKSPDVSAPAFVLHARLLVGIGEVEHGIRQYRRGVELDAGVADQELAARLGIKH